MEALAQFENTGLSTWLRESGAAFFTVLTVHSLAMGFVVGINLVISLRLTGFIAAIPLSPLRKFYPLHWICVGLIVLSGLALLVAYPAKALTNPVFYLKLVALILALVISRYFQLHMQSLAEDTPAPTGFHQHLRKLAVSTILLWIITITAGRFLAYTNSILLASSFY